jgi:ethanolamine utilization protein EutP
MVVGAVGAGKTSWLCALEGAPREARKTQMIDYSGTGIDTPGEYSEMPMFREHLMAAAADADVLVVVQDATCARSCFPPGYFTMFRQPTIGLVTKIDLPDADVGRATKLLRESGVKDDVFPVCAIDGTGLGAMRQRLLAYGLDQ